MTDDRANPADATGPAIRESVGFDALYRKNAINETAGGASTAAWQFFGGPIATVALGNDIVTSFLNNAQTRSAIQFGQTTPPWGSISTDQLGYDGAGRLIGKRHILSGATIVGFTTQYDPSSNKLFERALHAESRSSLYATDSLDRLLQYQRGVLATGGGSITTPIALPNTDTVRNYTLDGLGNWSNTSYTPVSSPPGIDVRTHNKLNQIVTFDAPSAPTAILYDHGNNTGANAVRGNGNIINDGIRACAFDALNRLVKVNRVSDGSPIGAYVYDALGRRIVRAVSNGGLAGTIPNGTSRYLLDGQRIVEELSGTAGTTTIQYVWGQYIDELIQLNAVMAIGPQGSTGKYYLLSDLLYRSVALTNSTGGVVEAYDTDAYGNTLLFNGPGADGLWFTNGDVQADYSACRYVFTGREYDAETQICSYRNRYFVGFLGRFLGRDPVTYNAGMNLYRYINSRPTSSTDAFGLDCDLESHREKLKRRDREWVTGSVWQHTGANFTIGATAEVMKGTINRLILRYGYTAHGGIAGTLGELTIGIDGGVEGEKFLQRDENIASALQIQYTLTRKFDIVLHQTDSSLYVVDRWFCDCETDEPEPNAGDLEGAPNIIYAIETKTQLHFSHYFEVVVEYLVDLGSAEYGFLRPTDTYRATTDSGFSAEGTGQQVSTAAGDNFKAFAQSFLGRSQGVPAPTGNPE